MFWRLRARVLMVYYIYSYCFVFFSLRCSVLSDSMCKTWKSCPVPEWRNTHFLFRLGHGCKEVKGHCGDKKRWVGHCRYNHVTSLSIAIAQLAKRRVTDRKVANSQFDSRTGHASLCSWERHLRLFPMGLPSLTKDLQAEPKKRCSVLVWIDQWLSIGGHGTLDKKNPLFWTWKFGVKSLWIEVKTFFGLQWKFGKKSLRFKVKTVFFLVFDRNSGKKSLQFVMKTIGTDDFIATQWASGVESL